jgi:hypothetical protein
VLTEPNIVRRSVSYSLTGFAKNFKTFLKNFFAKMKKNLSFFAEKAFHHAKRRFSGEISLSQSVVCTS